MEVLATIKKEVCLCSAVTSLVLLRFAHPVGLLLAFLQACDCATPPTVMCTSSATNDFYLVGNTEVTCTATDHSGNPSNICKTTVQVRDTLPPIMGASRVASLSVVSWCTWSFVCLIEDISWVPRSHFFFDWSDALPGGATKLTVCGDGQMHVITVSLRLQRSCELSSALHSPRFCAGGSVRHQGWRRSVRRNSHARARLPRLLLGEPVMAVSSVARCSLLCSFSMFGCLCCLRACSKRARPVCRVPPSSAVRECCPDVDGSHFALLFVCSMCLVFLTLMLLVVALVGGVVCLLVCCRPVLFRACVFVVVCLRRRHFGARHRRQCLPAHLGLRRLRPRHGRPARHGHSLGDANLHHLRGDAQPEPRPNDHPVLPHPAVI